MGIERARARRPALGQDLHREQLGVDFGLEGARRARFAFYAFVRLVRTKSDIPNIALFHCGITRAANKSSTPAAQAQRAGDVDGARYRPARNYSPFAPPTASAIQRRS